MVIQKIYLGYWYPRTTLHLAEVYDFLASGSSPLPLSQTKLHKLRTALRIESLRLDIQAMECLQIQAGGGISAKLFEDGLVVLTNDHQSIDQDVQELRRYFEDCFNPALSYLFSLGAPVPKELANIETILPYFVVTQAAEPGEAKALLQQLGSSEYFEIKTPGLTVHRGGQYYVIAAEASFGDVDGLIETLIYSREFKGQLHHYLNLHRQIWEKIETIKEQGWVRGSNVSHQRQQLESYRKSVELIEGRIKQMGIYAGTRSAIIKDNAWEPAIQQILSFRYDNLLHSLSYIQIQWTMTKRYLDTAIEIFRDIKSLSTRDSVQALTIISSIGVLSGLIGYFGTSKYPSFTAIGLVYFLGLLIGALTVNHLVSSLFKNRRYQIAGDLLAKKLD